MSLDRSLGDAQINGDILILFAVHKPAQNLRLSFAEGFSHSVAPSDGYYAFTNLCEHWTGRGIFKLRSERRKCSRATRSGFAPLSGLEEASSSALVGIGGEVFALALFHHFGALLRGDREVLDLHEELAGLIRFLDVGPQRSNTLDVKPLQLLFRLVIRVHDWLRAVISQSSRSRSKES
jgi:hypothetical protein